MTDRPQIKIFDFIFKGRYLDLTQRLEILNAEMERIKRENSNE